MRDKGDRLIMAIKPGWNRGLRYNIRDGRAVNIHRAKEKEKGDAYEDYLNRSYNSHRKEIANAKRETAKVRASLIDREGLHDQIVAELRRTLHNRDEKITELESSPKVRASLHNEIVAELRRTLRNRDEKITELEPTSKVGRVALNIGFVVIPVIVGLWMMYATGII
jgi:chromosome segregation ATPase